MGGPEEGTTEPTATTLSAAKDALRRRMRAARKAAGDPARLARAAETAQAALLGMDALRRASAVALYRAQPGEVPLAAVEAFLRRAGTLLLLPAWDPAAKVYRWRAWPEDASLEPGPLGIPQPTEPPDAGPMPDLAIVPGLAFDASGRRLGRGGGHYDRLLAGTPDALRVGLAFAFQCVPRVPTGPGDESMHWIVTEEGAAPAREEQSHA